jgi:hypothetical protein
MTGPIVMIEPGTMRNQQCIQFKPANSVAPRPQPAENLSFGGHLSDFSRQASRHSSRLSNGV